MNVGDMRKLLEDAPNDAPIHFDLGDHESPLSVYEQWLTTTLDGVYFLFSVPENWERK